MVASLFSISHQKQQKTAKASFHTVHRVVRKNLNYGRHCVYVAYVGFVPVFTETSPFSTDQDVSVIDLLLNTNTVML